MAYLGKNAKFFISGGEVGQITNISSLTTTYEKIDVTSYGSTDKEYMLGQRSNSDIVLTLLVDTRIENIFLNGDRESYSIRLGNGKQYNFMGYVTEYSQESPIGDVCKCHVTIAITGGISKVS